MSITIPDLDDPRMLRHVEIDGRYVLRLWDTYRREGNPAKDTLGYAFGPKDGDPIFIGEDFGASPCYAIDSDDTLRCLLGFLTLKPGDTDAEYFAEYTEEQHAFARGDAEYLGLWGMEPEKGEDPPAFVNLDGWDDD